MPTDPQLEAFVTTGKRLRLVLAAAMCATALMPGPAHAARPLETAITDGGPFITEPEWSFARVREAGARSVRLFVPWANIVPAGAHKPDGFNPRDHADPAYNWPGLDRQVIAAAAAGVSPILAISKAPPWAERPDSDFRPGTWRPRPSDFGDFAHAVATRYSGTFGGLPRVSRFQVWNEPNLFSHILPQYDTPISEQVTIDSHPESPNVYRPLVNALASEVHKVHPDNLVIAGGLAPFGRYDAYDHGVPPLQFMRELLCLTERNRPKPGCSKRVSFDVWSTHPYTQGGPTHSAEQPDNVSLGDLPEMRRVLRAGVRAGRIRSQNPVQFWVTEISWDTSPPDPGGVPLKLHARWVSEALYRMWQSGVSLVTWFQLRDEYSSPDKPDSREFTSGFYFFCSDGVECSRPKKRSLRAFRFPFVAFRHGRKIRFWGRTPAGVQADVTVQQHRGSHWRTVATMQTNQYGIFKGRFRTERRGPLRAKGLDDRSQPFSLKRPPDFAVNPFGGCEDAEAEHPVCPNR
jgi:hypothetical protein